MNLSHPRLVYLPSIPRRMQGLAFDTVGTGMESVQLIEVDVSLTALEGGQ